MSTRLHMVVPDELVQRIDTVRGDIPRSAWLRSAAVAFLQAWEAPTRSTGLGATVTTKSPPTAGYQLPKIAPRKTR